MHTLTDAVVVACSSVTLVLALLAILAPFMPRDAPPGPEIDDTPVARRLIESLRLD